MLEATFGPFAAVFEKGELPVGGYLTLLGLQTRDAQIAIERVAVALRHSDARRWFLHCCGMPTGDRTSSGP